MKPPPSLTLRASASTVSEPWLNMNAKPAKMTWASPRRTPSHGTSMGRVKNRHRDVHVRRLDPIWEPTNHVHLDFGPELRASSILLRDLQALEGLDLGRRLIGLVLGEPAPA